MRRAFIALAVFTLSALPLAAADTLAIDSAHSEASFQIRHLVTKVRGRFAEFSGTILMDAAKAENSSVAFTIKAASIDTGNAKRDEHLRSADFFDVAKFPELSFKSSKVSAGANGAPYQVTGNLTIRGVSKEITLPVSFLGKARDPWGNTRAGFETAIRINRKDYGINWNAALDQGGFMLSDDVDVSINLEAIEQKPAAK